MGVKAQEPPADQLPRCRQMALNKPVLDACRQACDAPNLGHNRAYLVGFLIPCCGADPDNVAAAQYLIWKVH
jgi:hypothetical protein